jgi:hypothetical protein
MKKHLGLLFSVVLVLTVALGACLNPIGFNSDQGWHIKDMDVGSMNVDEAVINTAIMGDLVIKNKSDLTARTIRVDLLDEIAGGKVVPKELAPIEEILPEEESGKPTIYAANYRISASIDKGLNGGVVAMEPLKLSIKRLEITKVYIIKVKVTDTEGNAIDDEYEYIITNDPNKYNGRIVGWNPGGDDSDEGSGSNINVNVNVPAGSNLGVLVIRNLSGKAVITKARMQYTPGKNYTLENITPRDYKSIALMSGVPVTIDITYKRSENDTTEHTLPTITKTLIPAGYNGFLNYVYFYKGTDGNYHAKEDGDPPEQGEISIDDDNEAEGSVPGQITDRNRDKVSLLIVKNVTEKQPVDMAIFQKEPRIYQMKPGPKAKNQNSILLGPGQWEVSMQYTEKGEVKVTTPKNVNVLLDNGSQAHHTLYLYFYQTKSGSYDVSSSWPPVPDDSANEGNLKPEDMLDPNQGILEITNKSESAKIIEKIRINDVDHTVMMMKDDVRSFVLNVGEIYVSFKPNDQTFFGLYLPRTIESRKVTKLSYYDSLSNPDSLPEDKGYGSGLLKITNLSTGVVILSTIVDTAKPGQPTMGLDYTNFIPSIPINYSRIGRVPVIGTGDFPLELGKTYLIQVTLETTDGLAVVERLATIRDELVPIVITQDDLKPVNQNGATVKVINQTTTPTQVVGMRIYNEDNPQENVIFDRYSWSPAGGITNGNNASMRVNSTNGFVITASKLFKADITVSGNGNIGIIRGKQLNSLYGTPANPKNVEVVITQSDIQCNCPGGSCPGGCDGNCGPDCNCPSLVERFEPVTNIDGMPTELLTQLSDTGVIINGGVLHLNNYAVVYPSNASKKSPIEWTQTGGSSKVTVSTNGTLTVNSTVVEADNNATVTVKATIPQAAGTLTSKSDYTKSFNITLKVSKNLPPSNPVNQINLTGAAGDPLSLTVGETKALTQKVNLSTQNGQPPLLNGVVITVNDLVWTISTDPTPIPTGQVTLSGYNSQNATGKYSGLAYVRATLPPEKNGGQTVSAIVTVKITPPPTRLVRFVALRDTDTVQQIAFVKVRDSEVPFFNTEDNCTGATALPHGKVVSGHRPSVWVTGHTGVRWTTVTNINTQTNINKKFKELYPTSTAQTLKDLQPDGTAFYETAMLKKGGKSPYTEFKDLVIPSGRYYIFFVEGDGRTRGYVNPGALDPAEAKNYLFVVDTDKLEDYYVWVTGTRKEVTEGTAGASLVLPIGYESYYNHASIMKSAGLNKDLIHDAN